MPETRIGASDFADFEGKTAYEKEVLRDTLEDIIRQYKDAAPEDCAATMDRVGFVPNP